MIRLFLLFTALYSVALQAQAQNETITRHYSKNLREVPADSAFSTITLTREGDQWFGKETFAKSGKVKSTGYYMDSDAKKPVGQFKNYKEDGTLFNLATYVNGKLSTIEYLYKSGKKMSMISYGENGNKQMGWDEDGKEIKNFVVEREAFFKGGLNGWRKYLEKTLNPNVAVDAGAPAGKYDVRVQFVVNKEGLVTNVKAVSAPSACRPCASEAINVISSAPAWEPAIQNNVPVQYNAIQIISFMVEEGKGKRKS